MPKNQVLSFMNNNSNIRVIVDSTNEVLFCLADICKALELTNPSKVKEYLIAEFDEDDLTGSYPIKDNFNTDKFDRTGWYALSDKFISEFKDWGL